jgi:hypothetical protein
MGLIDQQLHDNPVRAIENALSEFNQMSATTSRAFRGVLIREILMTEQY